MAYKYEDRDFLGFTFNGKHSFDYNIIRTSDGDMYPLMLSPEFENMTNTVVGKDGTYFFRSNYVERTFDISIAFDGMTESNLREMMQWLNQKYPCDLVFDEWPYKTYKAKIAAPPELNFLCFDEPDEINHDAMRRIYKGEGNISFICYEPFAKCTDKRLTEEKDYRNKNQWIESSGIIELNDYDVFSETSSPYTSTVYNPGDVDAPFILYLKKTNPTSPGQPIEWKTIEIELTKKGETEVLNKLYLTAPAKSGIEEIVIDTEKKLIFQVTGVTEKTGYVLNNLIGTGDFFKIPFGKDEYTIKVKCDCLTEKPIIEYNYLYY